MQQNFDNKMNKQVGNKKERIKNLTLVFQIKHNPMILQVILNNKIGIIQVQIKIMVMDIMIILINMILVLVINYINNNMIQFKLNIIQHPFLNKDILIISILHP
jgi:hypothetical protein